MRLSTSSILTSDQFAIRAPSSDLQLLTTATSSSSLVLEDSSFTFSALEALPPVLSTLESISSTTSRRLGHVVVRVVPCAEQPVRRESGKSPLSLSSSSRAEQTILPRMMFAEFPAAIPATRSCSTVSQLRPSRTSSISTSTLRTLLGTSSASSLPRGLRILPSRVAIRKRN